MVLAASTLSGNYIVWWVAQVVALALIVFLVLRWRPGFLGGKTIGQTVNSSLDSRAAQIKEQLEAAERSRQEAQRIREQSAQDVARAKEEAEDIVARASADEPGNSKGYRGPRPRGVRPHCRAGQK